MVFQHAKESDLDHDNIITLLFVIYAPYIFIRVLKAWQQRGVDESLEKELEKIFREKCQNYFKSIKIDYGPNGIVQDKKEKWDILKKHYSQFLSEDKINEIEREEPPSRGW